MYAEVLSYSWDITTQNINFANTEFRFGEAKPVEDKELRKDPPENLFRKPDWLKL